MGNYHAGKPDLQTRVELCVQMLAAERPWGTASRLAKEQGVSRITLSNEPSHPFDSISSQYRF